MRVKEHYFIMPILQDVDGNGLTSLDVAIHGGGSISN